MQSQEGRNLGKYSGVHIHQGGYGATVVLPCQPLLLNKFALPVAPSISLACLPACWPPVYESIPSRSIIYLSGEASAIISNLHSLLARWEQLVSWLLHTFGTYPTSISMREIAQQTFFTSISTFDCLKLVTKHFQALRTKPANSPSKTYVVRTAPL